MSKKVGDHFGRPHSAEVKIVKKGWGTTSDVLSAEVKMLRNRHQRVGDHSGSPDSAEVAMGTRPSDEFGPPGTYKIWVIFLQPYVRVCFM